MSQGTELPRSQKPENVMQTLGQMALSDSLAANLREMHRLFQDCTDIIFHEITPRSGPEAVLIYVDGMVQKDLIDRDIIAPILSGDLSGELHTTAAGLTRASEARILTTLGETAGRILGGDAVLLVDGTPRAVAYGVRGWQSRQIEEPRTEASIRGPREAFVETLRLNTAMMRRKIKSPNLKITGLKIGQITQTDVAVIYIDGVADKGVLNEVLDRLGRIEIDGVLEGGYLEEFIEDAPLSPFPQVQHTERPDVAAAQLLEGRVMVLVDGTPFALIVPVVFIEFLQTSEDYYVRSLYGSAIRLLRYLVLVIALLLPSLYVAVISYHQEMLPSALMDSISAAREGIPFPSLVEALLMEISFEILHEAGIRLPRAVGQAVSIVGALVIGEAAVRAGLVSAPMVIIVSITGISSFAIPRYNASMTIRLLRFPFMLLAGSLGMFGIMAGLCALLLHASSLRSFGVPYLSPVAPLKSSSLKDTMIRAPRWSMRRRPSPAGRENPIRQGRNLRPGPGQGEGKP